MTSIATISSLQTKDSLSPTHAPSRSFAYPSPTLSPVASFQSAIDAADYRRRTSAKELMASVNPPASPLDALVMALEATAESMAERSLGGQQFASLETTTRTDQDEDEDPNATVPSSPTFFIKAVNVLSLHQLPSLALPEAAVVNLAAPSTHSTNEPTSPLFSPTFNLTPSTRSVAGKSLRKMSVSSQDSADSFSSTSTSGDRHKSFSCSVTNCEKKFYQIAHLRIHERDASFSKPLYLDQ
ncbi:hypothetical protein EDD11_009654 [Mortierella claussenii]|nr:hypothetical protein EDD11_009654 [Mortierella claussenii]